jgi:2'-5' RNA ligase
MLPITDEQTTPVPGRYAIWLIPEVSVEQRFSGVIEKLSERYGCPRFAPHTTLLSGIVDDEDALGDKTASLAQELEAVDVKATGFAMEPYYFHSFYLKLEPSSALLLAHQKASQSFEKKAGNFLPHISLLYGAVAREEKISLGSELHNQIPGAFKLDRLYLVHTTLAVPNWTVVSRYDL